MVPSSPLSRKSPPPHPQPPLESPSYPYPASVQLGFPRLSSPIYRQRRQPCAGVEKWPWWLRDVFPDIELPPAAAAGCRFLWPRPPGEGSPRISGCLRCPTFNSFSVLRSPRPPPGFSRCRAHRWDTISRLCVSGGGSNYPWRHV